MSSVLPLPSRSLRRRSVSWAVGALVAGLLVGAPAPAPANAAPGSAAPVTASGGARAETEPLDILLLGDSYSAGNGASNEAGQPGTYGPVDCYRSRFNWAEQYAAKLRAGGARVRLVNHACSGGRSADLVEPRRMDTTSQSTPTPDGVTTLAQADAYLARVDLCATDDFPDEEFWTYRATAVDASSIDYDCTRMLRPQADFVTPETDLVLFTMGGNDAGFSTIVTECFLLKSASGCEEAVDSARAKLPQIAQLLLDGVAGLRAAGLRDDAKIVQLGYPYLQTDNGYVALGLPPYAAGDEVRSLIDDGTTALAGVATVANRDHPGQMTFVDGITEAFAGHEPDATTPVGNTDRWVNQIGDGTNTALWYHPNAQGQAAYAAVLARGGDYGATPPATGTVPTSVRARVVERSLVVGREVRVRARVVGTDRPAGRLILRAVGSRARDRAEVSPTGRAVLALRGLRAGPHRLVVTYAHAGERRSVTRRVVVRRR